MARTSVFSPKIQILSGICLVLGFMTACSSTSKPAASSGPASSYCRVVQQSGGVPSDAGCDPTQFPQLTPSPSDSAPQTDTDAPGSDSPSADSLTAVGTITVHGTGDTTTTMVSLGQPASAAQAGVPDDALTTCNWNSHIQATSVFIHGQLQISYQGNIAQPLTFQNINPMLLSEAEDPGAPLNAVNGEIAVQALDGSGSWDDCAFGGSPGIYTVQPGFTKTVDIWARVGALSNSEPTLSAADKASIAISVYAAAGDQAIGGAATLQASGPDAAHCKDDANFSSNPIELLPYTALPRAFDTLRCTAA